MQKFRWEIEATLPMQKRSVVRSVQSNDVTKDSSTNVMCPLLLKLGPNTQKHPEKNPH